MEQMKEIFRLKEMLENENIPFESIEHEIGDYQIGYPKLPMSFECIYSVIQNKYSYGNAIDLLEIWETSQNNVKGCLSAEDVFNRIKTHYKDGGIDERS